MAARGNQSKTRTQTKTKSVPSNGRRGGKEREYDHVDYKEGTVRLSAGLAETVAGMLISAVAGSERHQRKIRDSPAYTREYERFSKMKHPPEVQEWVVKHFRSGGAGLSAIESQIEIYIDELSAWMDQALRYHEGHWCIPNCDCVNYPEKCTNP